MKTSPTTNNRSEPKRDDSETESTAQAIFDKIMFTLKTEAFPTAIEKVLAEKFPNHTIIVWMYFNKQDKFYSLAKDILIPADTGLLSFFQKFPQPLSINKRDEHPYFNAESDNNIVPPDSHTFIIPILKRTGHPVGMIEISKPAKEKTFSRTDLLFGQLIMKKMSIYSNFLFPSESAISLVLSASFNDQFPQIVGKINHALEMHFKCRKADIWMYNTKKCRFFCFDPNREKPIQVEPPNAGVIGHCLESCTMIHERSVRSHPNYNYLLDGTYDEPVLAMPYVDLENRTWAVILRGRANPRYFTAIDVSDLRTSVSFIIHALSASMSPPQFEAQLDDFEQRLKALLDIAQNLSGTLDIDVLIPTIMDRAIQLLKSERCSLFLVDQTKQELVTHFHGGLDTEIRMPMNRGIVGHCAMTGETVNIEDAYLDSRFDKTVDLKTGYRTKSILCLPIYNNRGEIAGVTEMINKIGSDKFDADDIKMLMAFNVFCGISLDNAKLYQASLDLTKQLRTFVDLSAALSHADKIRNALQSILMSAMKAMDGLRATIYHIDQTNGKLTKLVNAGIEPKYDTIFAQLALQKLAPQIFGAQEIEEIVNSGADNKSVQDDNMSVKSNKANERQRRIASIITRNASIETMKSGGGAAEVNIVCSPMLTSENTPLGVLEIETAVKMMNENLKLLECFSVFAAISIEKFQLIDIVKLGQGERELKQMISDEERTLTTKIPEKMSIENDSIWKRHFDAQLWADQYITVLFNIFYRFDLPKEFNITNEKLFRFLTEIRDTYKKVPYHNWRHAVDVTQFVVYELLESGCDKVLTKFEVFALLVSAVCHDANHDGFTNVYNVKAETPLGILFKNQSVMETHHCQVAIGVISKEECNIFSALNAGDNRTMWMTIISLILSTDMAKHFEILKNFNAIMDAGEFSMENKDHRILLMQLLLKTADISNVSRPFDIANRWCDILCEEFFRQGDLEMAQGMEYTSDLNDKAHLDKPKSQIGFYTFVCLPLYQALARAFPQLSVNVKSVQSNLAIWKQTTEAKQKLNSS
ncbi:3'5'-cyclic nucleotide phosphodiesterase family protein [Trichomonas vaginalis G3]|uniref:3'5'-cyclic nucleotide phosphodiesterase family protein n=1 Tax=Trichomonas vaginalis (strain ATCC PRA-98 / G3) TaxID=412133 RepID=A2DF08_TRIV3|nr:cyclic nucleotide phosphodiesterase family [Trichomonas vaginalis G3]EAY21000.1 3'5'-cyclic nucleotide phosphodiesterase family protein [Trichomonas vaginalis G3]KAI5519171.1 cyclic nucleotide phosphodiesterase family [Trichomonas vaginalis G3]|eukprot:XP_001581986.1 3'5'-cyclic nucleotide phosphodiesterase family protein [Trichomonas vaginalis G3]